MSDHDAFLAGASYVRLKVEEAGASAVASNRPGALEALGAALHALQDLHAHSNMVDLSTATADSVEAAVWDESAPVPAGLRSTGYDASARDPEKPVGDTYSHREFAKDSPRKNAESQARIAGKSKYLIAKGLALEASITLIRKVEGQVEAPTWRALWQ